MTPLKTELDRLKRLCDEATEGPWDESPASEEWKRNKVANARFCRESRQAMPRLIEAVEYLLNYYTSENDLDHEDVNKTKRITKDIVHQILAPKEQV